MQFLFLFIITIYITEFTVSEIKILLMPSVTCNYSQIIQTILTIPSWLVAEAALQRFLMNVNKIFSLVSMNFSRLKDNTVCSKILCFQHFLLIYFFSKVLPSR